MNALPLLRELLALVSPDANVPAALVSAALAEALGAPPAADHPPTPDGWTVDALAARYGCAPSTARSRVQEGEFGAPGVDGGPQKRGRWLVPHAAVLARDLRVRCGAPAADPALPDLGTPPTRNRTFAPTSLVDARRQRVAATRENLVE